MAVIWHDINKMTSNTSLSPVVVSTSNGNYASSEAYRVFDGDATASGRATNINGSGNLTVDFGVSTPLSSIRVVYVSPSNATAGTVISHSVDISVSNSASGTYTSLGTFNSPNITLQGANTIYEVVYNFDYVEYRSIRFSNFKRNLGTVSTTGTSSNNFVEMYIGYEPPTYKANFELYNSFTSARINNTISGALLKDGVINRSVTFSSGVLALDNLDNTSTWEIRTNQTTAYNALSPTSFTPAYSNPTIGLYLKPTVKKKFNFKDENGANLSGKSVSLKIYKDGSTTPLIDTTVTTSTYTTAVLYDGSYTYEITCEGYSSIKGALAYDDSELNINFTIFTPTNKTLILHDGEYKKWIQGQEESFGKNIIPTMTSATTPRGEVISSGDYSTIRASWKAFNNTVENYTMSWASTDIMPSWIGYDFQSKKYINGYSLTSATNNKDTSLNGDGMPKNWKFQGSNDKKSWTDLHTVTNQSSWGNSEKRMFTFSNPHEDGFIYYRIYITSNNRPSSNITYISEIKMHEGITAVASEWSTVSSTLPTSQQFLDDGMDSLSSLLERRVETLEPLPMTDISEILNGEAGKLLSKTIDLKKYMDIRSIKFEQKK